MTSDELVTSSAAGDIRDYWDADAATYDRAATHDPRSPAELAAWRGALQQLLPPLPARVLDVGAGTGFLSLLLADLGYAVTAVDLSPGMLEQLRRKAHERGASIEVVEGDAQDPALAAGDAGFDAVIERHVLWTLPDPRAALAAWRELAPDGRLVLLESVWGIAADPIEHLRARARAVLRRVRGTPPEHHAEYDEGMRAALPLGRGTPPEELLRLIVASGWGSPMLHRLADVEWAIRSARPAYERLLGVPPRFAIRAGG